MTVVGAPQVPDAFAAVAALTARAAQHGLAAGVPLVAAGLLALTVATRGRRALASLGLAAIGALAAAVLRGPIAAHTGVGLLPAAVALGCGGALVGAVLPWAFPFAAAALPAALAGSLLPLWGRAAIGAAAAGLIVGLLGLALARVVAATAASLAGGLLLGIGLLACLARHPLARELAARPAAVLGFAIVTGIAGAAYQLARARARSPGGPAARSPGSPPAATPAAGR